MLEFRTVFPIVPGEDKIDYSDKIMFIGSCFAENVGLRLQSMKFNCKVNPFGIIYNPFSVAHTLYALVENRQFSDDDLVFSQGQWHSMYHHGKFSSSDREECLNIINAGREESSSFLKDTKYLIITFGTSWVYKYIKTNTIISNCHKLPASEFIRYRLTVNDIVKKYIDLISKLSSFNPNLRIIFTVSPVRHWKDGAHGNQLSKSVLLLAIDELVNTFDNISYFPSYELIMDDLRDYRFYSDDMLHISDTAVDYIWERFRETYLSKGTESYIKRISKLRKALSHRPFNDTDSKYLIFLEKQKAVIENLQKEIPDADFEEEISIINSRL